MLNTQFPKRGKQMIPAYILHPHCRRLEAPDPQSNVDIGAGTADLRMVHAEAVFPAAVKIHRQTCAAVPPSKTP